MKTTDTEQQRKDNEEKMKRLTSEMQEVKKLKQALQLRENDLASQIRITHFKLR